MFQKSLSFVACLALASLCLVTSPVNGNCPDDTVSSPSPTSSQQTQSTHYQNIASGTLSPSLTMQNMVVTSSNSQGASSSMTTSFPVQTPSPTPVTPWINTIPDQKNTQVNAQPVCVAPPDCKTWLELGAKKSKIYPVSPNGTSVVLVYCDMITDGGGWTLFLRRKGERVEFHRNWATYESGFGDLNGEHWLGNAKMHQLTNQGGTYTLRVEVGDYGYGNTRYAKYSTFSIGDRDSQYKLTVTGYYDGTAGDSLKLHSGYGFSAYDRDNDDREGGNCAEHWAAGGWWYHGCHQALLTGAMGHNIFWPSWRGITHTFSFAEMKFRRN